MEHDHYIWDEHLNAIGVIYSYLEEFYPVKPDGKYTKGYLSDLSSYRWGGFELIRLLDIESRRSDPRTVLQVITAVQDNLWRCIEESPNPKSEMIFIIASGAVRDIGLKFM